MSMENWLKHDHAKNALVVLNHFKKKLKIDIEEVRYHKECNVAYK